MIKVEKNIIHSKIISGWVEEFSDSLYSWAFYKTSHRESAEDLVQDTFIAAFQTIDKFENKSNPKTWLFSILNNKIYDYYRNKFKNSSSTMSNKELKSEEEFYDNFFDENDKWVIDKRPTHWNETQNLMDDDEFLAILDYCKENLPELWFSAINFKYLTDKDSKEICKDLNITPSNYWQILHRAKLQLRLCIENNWFKK